MRNCFFFCEKQSAHAKKWAFECYAYSAPSEKIIRKWFTKFRTTHISTEYIEPS